MSNIAQVTHWRLAERRRINAGLPNIVLIEVNIRLKGSLIKRRHAARACF
jgi:hypothetical protein